MFYNSFIMNWLIIGTGWISEEFVKALNRNKENVTYVLSRDENKAKDFADQYKIPHYGKSFHEALKYIDAVYIGTPNSTHAAYAKAAIKHKKHVMVEKPLTHSYRHTKSLFKLAEKNGVKLMEAFVHITQPEYQELKGKGNKLQANLEKVSSKIHNDTYMFASSFSKEMYGGVLPDLGVYPIALSVLIHGKVKKHYIANTKFMNGVEVECSVILQHKGGKKSKFLLSKVRDGDNKVYIDGINTQLTTSASHIPNRMDAEVKEFISGKKLSVYKEISLETSKVLTRLKRSAEAMRWDPIKKNKNKESK